MQRKFPDLTLLRNLGVTVPCRGHVIQYDISMTCGAMTFEFWSVALVWI